MPGTRVEKLRGVELLRAREPRRGVFGMVWRELEAQRVAAGVVRE